MAKARNTPRPPCLSTVQTRRMDLEYYDNIFRWTLGREGKGTTIWVEDQSYSHVRRSLEEDDRYHSLLSSGRVKIRHISEMYDDALVVNPGLKSTLAMMKIVEQRESVGLDNHAARSDLFRLLALYTYGGLYSDLDNEYGTRKDIRKMRDPAPPDGQHSEAGGTLYVPELNNSVLFASAPKSSDALEILTTALNRRRLLYGKAPSVELLDVARGAMGSPLFRGRRGKYESTIEWRRTAEMAVNEAFDKLPEEAQGRLAAAKQELYDLVESDVSSLISHAKIFAREPFSSPHRWPSVRGKDRIAATLYTTGPEMLAMVPFRRRLGKIATSGSWYQFESRDSAQPVSVREGQHTAWAKDGDGDFYEKREKEVDEERLPLPRRRVFSATPRFGHR